MKLGVRIPGPLLRAPGLEPTLDWLAEQGFDGVDLPMPPTAEQVAACRDRELTIGTFDGRSVGATMSADAERRREAAEALAEEIRDAAALGCHTMFVCLVPEDGTQARKDSFEAWRESFPRVVAEAEEQDVRIAIESWPGGAPTYPAIGCSPEMLRAMFAAIPSPNLGLCYDPSHFLRLDIDYLRLLAEFSERIFHVHAKDTEILKEGRYLYGILPPALDSSLGFGEGSWRYTLPGHGAVEWHRVVARLTEAGYDGLVSIELEDHRFWGSPEKIHDGLLRSRDYLRPLL